MDKEWVIAGKVKGTLPEIGKTYEIRDVRKGTYTGRIMNVRGEFADVEVTDGLPRFAGFESRLAYDGELTIRAGLVYLIEKHPE